MADAFLIDFDDTVLQPTIAPSDLREPDVTVPYIAFKMARGLAPYECVNMSQVTSLSPPPPVEVTDEAANWDHFARAASPSSTLVEPSETAEDASTGDDPASPAQIFEPVVDDEDTAAVSPGAIEEVVVSASEDSADKFDDASDKEENLDPISAPVTASNDGPLDIEPADQVQLTVRAVKDWYWKWLKHNNIPIPKTSANRKSKMKGKAKGKAKLQDTTNQVRSIAQSSKKTTEKNITKNEDEEDEENQDGSQADEPAAARCALMLTLEKTKMKTMPLDKRVRVLPPYALPEPREYTKGNRAERREATSASCMLCGKPMKSGRETHRWEAHHTGSRPCAGIRVLGVDGLRRWLQINGRAAGVLAQFGPWVQRTTANVDEGEGEDDEDEDEDEDEEDENQPLAPSVPVASTSANKRKRDTRENADDDEEAEWEPKRARRSG